MNIHGSVKKVHLKMPLFFAQRSSAWRCPNHLPQGTVSAKMLILDGTERFNQQQESMAISVILAYEHHPTGNLFLDTLASRICA